MNHPEKSMSTITQEQQESIRSYLSTHVLLKGLGSAESACSIAAINLALTGTLTDKIPDCMSNVIGRWIIRVQDSMPDKMRNSSAWKSLLPLAASTGRDSDAEKRRINLVLGWMWDTVLTHLQPIAEAGGYGEVWLRMTTEKSADAAYAADAAAYAANAAAYAAYAAAYAADAAAYAADAAASAANAAAYAADAAAYAADAAAYAAKLTSWEAAWDHFDPCALLEKLIDA